MDSTPQNKPTTGGHHHQPQSSSELFSSAKVLAEAGQATYGQGTVDKAKAAGAASDLLDAGCQYGKLEDGKYGQYIGKAETYLDKYESSDNSSTNAAAHGGGENKHQTSDQSGGGTTVQSGGGHGQSEGGHGEAEVKNSGGGESGGGYGQYFKMAEGFLK
ncbi:hypothetical protein Vadar_020422 [Vaccinium darrowii]|uniref:Uncharacterized protein n=1 Tax=Vaccinium darrowii TaxID=229202 RepID=A0ACB7YNV9_9ERIC|nr:hypothetical protein Vadar_020422 [Vaccinium darrowii]